MDLKAKMNCHWYPWRCWSWRPNVWVQVQGSLLCVMLCSQAACQMLSLYPVAIALFHRFSGSEIFLSMWNPNISSQVLPWLSVLAYTPDSLEHCCNPILKVSILVFLSPEAFLLEIPKREKDTVYLSRLSFLGLPQTLLNPTFSDPLPPEW